MSQITVTGATLEHGDCPDGQYELKWTDEKTYRIYKINRKILWIDNPYNSFTFMSPVGPLKADIEWTLKSNL